jgi:hypothetical protein
MSHCDYLIKSALSKSAGRWDRKLADIIRGNPQGQAASVLGGYLRDFGDFKVPTRQSIRQIVGKKQVNDMEERAVHNLGQLNENVRKSQISPPLGKEKSKFILSLIMSKLKDVSSYEDRVAKYFQDPSTTKSLMIMPLPAARKSVSDYLTKPVVG